MDRAREIAANWTNGVVLQDESLLIDLEDYRIAVRSNSRTLLDSLGRYFSLFLGEGPPEVEVTAIEVDPVESAKPFCDWRREPGKIGRKDAYFDLADGRLVRKVRTGMLFLQSTDHRIAIGPCQRNDNQVINFINCQYMNWLQQNDALICHAAGVVLEDRCLAIAGFSGGGKSTLMLHLLQDSEANYLTNDRLFLRTGADDPMVAAGIAKMPRVNPGTILSLPALCPLLSPSRRDALRLLTMEELWNLEEKYDVDVERLFGPRRMTLRAPLGQVLILNWKRDTDRPCKICRVDLDARPDLLAALMKPSGPFYQYPDGSFQRDDVQPRMERYRERLQGTTVWEVRGRVDFKHAVDHCRSVMGVKACSRT